MLPGVSFAWQVNDPDLGRVNDIGYLTVVGEARTFKDAITVTGVWEGVTVSKTSDVLVMRTPKEDDFLEVQVLPQRVHLEPGDQLQLRAVTLNGLGEVVTGTELRWSLTDPRAGVIDGTGHLVAGDTPGIYAEAVRVEGVFPGEQGFVLAVDFASVVVRKSPTSRRLEAIRVLPESVTVAPGARGLLTVQGVDEFGKSATNLMTSWEATGSDVGKIDEHGSFEATGSPGKYPDALRVTVEQELDGQVITKTASVDVVITGTLTEVEMQPRLATISPGRTVHFRVAGRDQNGVPLTGLVVLWSLAGETLGRIDAFGNFTAGEELGMFPDAIRAKVLQTIAKPR